MEDITKKFTHLYNVISSPNFLKKESLGGEIPFFISAYDAKRENDVAESIKLLRNKLDNAGVSVLEINLYDVVCDILSADDDLNEMFSYELSVDKDKFINALRSTLNMEVILIPKIKKLIDENPSKVYFLTGIGLVFPYLRSHTILNNLQNVAKESPTVIFFPGEYNGSTLNLFGLLKDDNYYRAFNIDIIDPRP